MTTSSLSNRDEEKVVGLAETAESSPSTSRDASPPTFNEQTNYVPTKQIVTVSLFLDLQT